MSDKLVRVATLNNYNFTRQEEASLRSIVEAKKYDVFVNSNSFVKVTATFPSILTINPYLAFVEPSGDLSNVKACRVKVVAAATPEIYEETDKAIKWSISKHIPVLLTFQRWRTTKSLEAHTTEDRREYYKFTSGWFRPMKPFRDAFIEKQKTSYSFKDSKLRKLIYVCDEAGEGCPSCNNCTRLTHPDRVGDDIHSLNLSCSGDCGRCIFNCPDCFAKQSLERCGGTPLLDSITRNRKQKGELKHE